MKHIYYVTILLFFALTLKAYAENFQLQNIRVGGIGCPSDVTQIMLAPDNSSASIIFQGFESHVPQTTPNEAGKLSRNISEINCNVFLDVKLPKGQKLDSLEVSFDMRGHAFLARGVTGNFKSFLIGQSGLGSERNQGVQLIQEKSWLNTSIDQEEDFLIQSTKSIAVPSNCHGDELEDKVSIHLQHHLASQILRGATLMNAEGTLTMDSSDIKGGLRVRAQTSTCIPQSRENRGGNSGGRNCRVIRVNGRAQTVCN
jgi:hypothetical protein